MEFLSSDLFTDTWNGKGEKFNFVLQKIPNQRLCPMNLCGNTSGQTKMKKSTGHTRALKC